MWKRSTLAGSVSGWNTSGLQGAITSRILNIECDRLLFLFNNVSPTRRRSWPEINFRFTYEWFRCSLIQFGESFKTTTTYCIFFKHSNIHTRYWTLKNDYHKAESLYMEGVVAKRLTVQFTGTAAINNWRFPQLHTGSEHNVRSYHNTFDFGGKLFINENTTLMNCR